MAIHHSTIKRAEKNGIILEEVDGGVTATNHQYGVRVGPVAKAQDALMSAILRIEQKQKEEYDGGMVDSPSGDGQGAVDNDPVHVDSPSDSDADEEEVARSADGVPLDGAIAYKEKYSAADNPYSTEEDDEEYELAAAWDEAWDAAADEAQEEEGSAGGSVVSSRYRALYAEKGHPTHCGDWLATMLNNLVIVGKHTNLDLFEEICGMNGVDMSKYNRTTPGWQGRFRMTGRNLLAKKVYLAGGVLLTPDETYKAPADWMEGQRFKMPKADQSKPIPTADAE